MIKKKPVWVENLEKEREVWTEALSGYGNDEKKEDTEKWNDAIERIKVINAILEDAGYLKKTKVNRMSADTKAMVGVSIFQTASYWISDMLGRLPNRDPFLVKPRFKI